MIAAVPWTCLPGALSLNYHQFGREAPATPGAPGFVQRANDSLSKFLHASGISSQFAFGAYNRNGGSLAHRGAPFRIDIRKNRAVLRFDAEYPPSRALLQRSLAFVPVLENMFRSGPMLDCRFLADASDGAHEERACFCSPSPTSCLLPDSDFVSSEGYAATRSLIRARMVGWADRNPTVFWRGSTTGQRRHAPPGPDAANDDFRWLPRLDLCHRARKSSQAARYDVGIASIVRIPEPYLRSRIELSGLCTPRVTREAFLNRKAILVIDGNSNAWSALFNALLTGACVLKVDSPRQYKQWYYDDLTPWLHFVPVKEDLSDLEEKVSWVFDHDAAAGDIGAAGKAFADAMTLEKALVDCAAKLRQWIPARELNLG